MRLGFADAALHVTGTPDRLDADRGERDAGALSRVLEHARRDAGRVVQTYDEREFGDQNGGEDEGHAGQYGRSSRLPQ